jgi:hypothetical protein
MYLPISPPLERFLCRLRRLRLDLRSLPYLLWERYRYYEHGCYVELVFWRERARIERWRKAARRKRSA